jgi:hypothetical protein
MVECSGSISWSCITSSVVTTMAGDASSSSRRASSAARGIFISLAMRSPRSTSAASPERRPLETMFEASLRAQSGNSVPMASFRSFRASRSACS